MTRDKLGYHATKLDWEISALATDRKQLFLLGERGRRSFLLAMRPDGSPKVVSTAPGLSIATMLVHEKQLLHANRTGLHASRGGAFRKLLRCEIDGLGLDGGGGVWAITRSRTRKKEGAGSPEYRYEFLHSKNGTRFRATNDLELESYLMVQGSCSKGLLFTALQDGTLYRIDSKGTIFELDTPPDEYFSSTTIFATRKGTLLAGDEWRSTDMGKTWKRPKSVNGILANALLETSTGVIVILGESRGHTRLLISRDDGARFSELPVRFKGTSSAIAELGGSLFVANGDRLVRLPLPT